MKLLIKACHFNQLTEDRAQSPFHCLVWFSYLISSPVKLTLTWEVKLGTPINQGLTRILRDFPQSSSSGFAKPPFALTTISQLSESNNECVRFLCEVAMVGVDWNNNELK